jgi:hypothetical protein
MVTHLFSKQIGLLSLISYVVFNFPAKLSALVLDDFVAAGIDQGRISVLKDLFCAVIIPAVYMSEKVVTWVVLIDQGSESMEPLMECSG